MNENNIHILIVEDNRDHQLLIEKQIKQKASLVYSTAVDTLEKAEYALSEMKVDVVLLDLKLPDFIGLETVNALTDRFPSIPFIVLTSLNDDTIAIDALEEGAEDYLLKDELSPVGLYRSIRHSISRKAVEMALRKSQEGLKRSNEELVQLAGVIAHDLRSPLRAVKHLAEWIEEDSGHLLLEPSKEHLTAMHHRIARMDKMIMDLLRYAQIGEEESDLSQVSFGDLVEEARSLVFVPDSFTIHTLNKDLPLLILRAPVVKVLKNLIDNAIKHHDKEQGNVWVSVKSDGQYLEFSVKDDGPGISPALHDQIFKIFKALDTSEHGRAGGMGLAIVLKTVQANGGLVYLDSDVGTGSTFSFTWPRVMNDPERTASTIKSKLREYLARNS